MNQRRLKSSFFLDFLHYLLTDSSLIFKFPVKTVIKFEHFWSFFLINSKRTIKANKAIEPFPRSFNKNLKKNFLIENIIFGKK